MSKITPGAARRRSMWRAALAMWVLASLAGCAAMEFSRTPEAPELRVVTKAEGVYHPSPPPLPETIPVPPTVEAPPPGEPLNLTVEGAIVLALEHNQSLEVQRTNPAIQQTLISEQRSVFDPTLVGDYSHTRNEQERDLRVFAPVSFPTANGGTAQADIEVPVESRTRVRTDGGSVGVSQTLPTGTDLSVTFGPSRTTTRNGSSDRSLVSGTDTDVNASSLQVAVTQRLLRGAGLGVNLANLRQSRISALSSQYELRGFAEDLISQVEQTYWNYLLAERQIRIFEDSLTLAEDQAKEVEERINVGRVAESERDAADAEVAQRRSSLIDARSNMAQVRLALLRLVNPSEEALRSQEVRLTSEPLMPELRLDEVENSVTLAKRWRPEVNQAKLLIQSDDLELVQTRNGLLPQLDLFVQWGKDLSRTGYASSFEGSSRTLRNTGEITEMGARFSYPIGNRAARARNSRAELTRQRDREALHNLTQLVEQDVRGAYIEANRAREQVTATAATRRLQETVLSTETEKFRVGKSTAILVAQAQRDLLSAQINEVKAATAYLQSIVNLYRLEGTLLLRRGVACPGENPVD